MNILGISCYIASFTLLLFSSLAVLKAPQSAPAIELEAIAARLENTLERKLELRAQDNQAGRQPVTTIDEQFDDRFERLQTIEITSTSRGYWLVAPKLMLAVQHLGGGDLRIKFADRYEQIRVGQRLDLRVDDCRCFLVLTESVKAKAIFQFGCEKQLSGRLAAVKS